MDVLDECYKHDHVTTHRLLVRELDYWSPRAPGGPAREPRDLDTARGDTGRGDTGRRDGPSARGDTGSQDGPSEEGQAGDQHGCCAEEDERPTLLSMAESFQMMKFTGQPACQAKLGGMWKGEMEQHTSPFVVIHFSTVRALIACKNTVSLIFFYIVVCDKRNTQGE